MKSPTQRPIQSPQSAPKAAAPKSTKSKVPQRDGLAKLAKSMNKRFIGG